MNAKEIFDELLKVAERYGVKLRGEIAIVKNGRIVDAAIIKGDRYETFRDFMKQIESTE